MKNRYVLAISLLLFGMQLFAQEKKQDMHEVIKKYIEVEKIDSIYTSSLGLKPIEKGYKQALLYRNKYGWLIGKTEQLIKDIPAILKLKEYSRELAYLKIFDPQDYPSSEWNSFYEMTSEVLNSFDTGTNEFRDVLAQKITLEFLLRKEKELLIDLPKILSLLDKGSEEYSNILWNYSNVLITNKDSVMAEKIFKDGWVETGEIRYLHSLIKGYSRRGKYDLVIEYDATIRKDTSNVLMNDLGLAYLNKQDSVKAEDCFNKFVNSFTIVDYQPYVQIKYGNYSQSIGPEELKILGDFYYLRETEKACDLYSYALNVLKNPIKPFSYNDLLVTEKNKEKREEMIAKMAEYLLRQNELLKSIEEILEECK